jgi:hypothetical protein
VTPGAVAVHGVSAIFRRLGTQGNGQHDRSKFSLRFQILAGVKMPVEPFR